MAKVKYRIREFQPTANQTGGHSFYAEAVIDNVITNKELAKKIEARGISRASEIKSILEEAANIIYEECLENNRVQLESEGGALVSIYPSCSGSVSDKDVVANPDKYEGTVATADMVTPDIIKWTLGASIGRKFAQQFAANKQAQRVDYNPNQQTADPEPNNGGNNNGGGTLVDDPDGD